MAGFAEVVAVGAALGILVGGILAAGFSAGRHLVAVAWVLRAFRVGGDWRIGC